MYNLPLQILLCCAQALCSETSYCYRYCWSTDAASLPSLSLSLSVCLCLCLCLCVSHTVLCGALYTTCVDASRMVFWDRSLGWFCGCIATGFKMVIHCCCFLRSPICLLIMVCPCFSLVPLSKVLKERSISKSSGDVDREELADIVVSGLEAFHKG